MTYVVPFLLGFAVSFLGYTVVKQRRVIRRLEDALSLERLRRA